MGRLNKSLKKLLAVSATKTASPSGNSVSDIIECIADNHSLILVSPDKKVWDLKIANDGTISAQKRT